MYIVTGGAGFIGSAMLWRLNLAGINDILVVDNLGKSIKWKNLVNRRYVRYIQRDEFLRSVREGAIKDSIEAVIHMGACSSTTEEDADFFLANNTQYTIEMCRFALERGARFITASSAATYGDGTQGFSDRLDNVRNLKPLNIYGYSKHLFDLWLMNSNLTDKVVSLKFFNVYGPNEYHKGNMRSVACKAFQQISQTGRMQLFKSAKPDYADGGQQRDFVYVKDCVEMLFWFLFNKNINGIFNVGSGQARTFQALVQAVFCAMDREVAIDYIEMPEILRDKYQYFTQADMSWLAQHNCPIKFTSLEDGVHDYVHNYLSQKDPYLEQ